MARVVSDEVENRPCGIYTGWSIAVSSSLLDGFGMVARLVEPSLKWPMCVMMPRILWPRVCDDTEDYV